GESPGPRTSYAAGQLRALLTEKQATDPEARSESPRAEASRQQNPIQAQELEDRQWLIVQTADGHNAAVLLGLLVQAHQRTHAHTVDEPQVRRVDDDARLPLSDQGVDRRAEIRNGDRVQLALDAKSSHAIRSTH